MTSAAKRVSRDELETGLALGLSCNEASLRDLTEGQFLLATRAQAELDELEKGVF